MKLNVHVTIVISSKLINVWSSIILEMNRSNFNLTKCIRFKVNQIYLKSKN